MQSRPGEFEYLPHTADAKFRAHGKTLEEAFRNAARALFAIITDIDKLKPKLRFEINIKAKDREAALFDFLDRLLFLLDTESLLVKECEEMRLTRNSDGSCTLTCVVVGDHYRGYDCAGQVKAVTYNDMRIERQDHGYVVQVVVDI